jgi:hypothetical protein
MISAKQRLILVVVLAALFLSWIGYLAFLAFTSRHPIVLSRPQLLAADLDVVAEVDSLDKPVVVREVVSPQKPGAEANVGRSIAVTNLKACQADWKGSGLYILPLMVKKNGDEEKFEVAVASQRMPGLDPAMNQGQQAMRMPRIYPATVETRAQLAQVTNP